LKAEGKVLKVGDKHSAVMGGILYNSSDDVCVKSKADFAVFSPKVAKRLGIADDASLKFFADIFGIR
jgi:hypothetical protein